MDEFHVSHVEGNRNKAFAIFQITRSAYLVVDLYTAGRKLIKRAISKEYMMLWIRFSWFWINLSKCTMMILFHEDT